VASSKRGRRHGRRGSGGGLGGGEGQVGVLQGRLVEMELADGGAGGDQAVEHLVGLTGRGDRAGDPALVVRAPVDADPQPQPAAAAAQPVRGVLGGQPAAVQDGDAVGQLSGLLQVLGGQEDGAALVAQLAHLLPERPPALGIEAGTRLVQEQHGRPVQQGAGQVESAAGAARVGGDAPVQHPTEAQPVHHLADPGGGGTARRLPQGGQEAQQLAAGHGLVQGGVLHGHPDGPAHRGRVAGDVVAGDPGRSGGGGGQGGEDADGGGLARAVPAQVGEDLPVAGPERHLVQGPHLTRVDLAQFDRLDRRLCHGPPPF
jgi:hypothetical protein